MGLLILRYCNTTTLSTSMRMTPAVRVIASPPLSWLPRFRCRCSRFVDITFLSTLPCHRRCRRLRVAIVVVASWSPRRRGCVVVTASPPPHHHRCCRCRSRHCGCVGGVSVVPTAAAAAAAVGGDAISLRWQTPAAAGSLCSSGLRRRRAPWRRVVAIGSARGLEFRWRNARCRCCRCSLQLALVRALSLRCCRR